MILNDLLLLQAPIPIAALDQDLKFQGFSEAWHNQFRTDRSTKGSRIAEVFPDMPEELFLDLSYCREGLERSNDRIFYRHADGKIAWYSWKMSPLAADGPMPGGILLVLEDITDQMRDRDLFEKMERVARIGTWEVDMVKNQIFWSPNLRALHEVPPDYEPVMEEVIKFYKEGASKDLVLKVLDENVRTGEPWDIEVQLITAKGREIWVRGIGEVDMHNGKCIRIRGTMQDIDKRKKARLEFKKVSERLNIAKEGAEIGIWDFDVVGQEVAWDERMHDIFGIEAKKFESIFAAWQAALHPDDREWVRERMGRDLQSAGKFQMDYRIVRPDGETRWIHDEGNIVRDPDGKPLQVIGAAWDVTRQKMAEEEMKKLLNTTVSQNESLLNFAHIVSHNLRSHATNLSMITQFLLEDRIAESERKNALQMLAGAANGLNDSITHLNEVVQVQTGNQEAHRPVNLFAAAHKAETELAALLQAEGVRLDVDIDMGLEVMGIPAYLDSLFLNMITNGMKYRDPEKESFIRIGATVENGRCRMDFTDNGLGIDLQRHGAKLFGMYKTFHKHKDSRGIGLFITKNQVEAMGGKITVSSQPGAGTTFSVILNTTDNT
ncbi:PAS domain-containing protein [Robiginitalea biformata]|uniref:histidine kinase n=1 Tax=Robiginitalea biformata (strain ATCC BAA-864 / DSM 15991 / KCTC 12146 / HTCC2501) TaxID=313596 RepID=A4CIB1_ROBBH|nr:PAS domain-containing protein [Robiginitalea biformata]EAR16669.1 histidine kinase sensor protein [Robiginitalea biformata HTCC2501]